MRRFVKGRVDAALELARPSLEDYVSRHLEYPLGFPHKFAAPAVLLREFQQLKVAPLAKADLPPVRVEVLLKAWLANRAVRIRGDWDPGVLYADVQLTARGTVNADGTYSVEPRSAALKAWWRDTMMVEARPSNRVDPSA
jgi:hypothetical protein